MNFKLYENIWKRLLISFLLVFPPIGVYKVRRSGRDREIIRLTSNNFTSQSFSGCSDNSTFHKIILRNNNQSSFANLHLWGSLAPWTIFRSHHVGTCPIFSEIARLDQSNGLRYRLHFSLLGYIFSPRWYVPKWRVRFNFTVNLITLCRFLWIHP